MDGDEKPATAGRGCSGILEGFPLEDVDA